MAVTINIPSQVKTYANLAAFPASGSLKTIYIAEDTNKTYRWTGSVYVEISASAAMTWGQIGGTLSNQTDLQNALDAKVPTARTLTINGTTQDLSANRTFTVPTDLTIGTTPIASGTIGRVLFQGTGNVLQQSSSLFWDSTNNRLGIGTETPLRTMDVRATQSVVRISSTTNTNSCGLVFNNFAGDFWIGRDSSAGNGFGMASPAYAGVINARGNYPLYIGRNDSNDISIFTTGNIGINTTTDAGFRLDVNGTARVQGTLTIPSTGSFGITVLRLGTSGIAQQVYNNGGTTYLGADSSAGAFLFTNGLPYASFFGNGANYPTQFGTNGAIRMTIFAGGNVGINTTTDAGFRLDVNGTARVSGALSVTTGGISVSGSSSFTSGYIGIASTGSGGIYGLTINQPIYLWNRQTSTGNGIVIDDFNGVAGGNLNLNLLNVGGAYSTTGTCVHNTISITRAINMASGTQTVRGFYYNPTLTNTTGLTTHYAFHSTIGRIRFENLPTSSAGLSAGDIWNDGGTLKIV
jgi:hypothetical protein